MSKGIYMAVLLFSVFISAASQILLKNSAGKKYSSPIREYLNAPVITAYIIFALATFLTIFAYRVVPLSLGAVLEATSYLYVTFFGVTIFKEKITKKKMLALALILIGIAVSSFFG